MKFPDLPLVILDTETTGLLPRVNRIIEFASVRMEEGKQVDEYEQLISFGGDIPPEVEVLTRIQSADLAGKPLFEDAREEIVRHIGEDSILVGQNIPYDMAMLKGEGIDLSERPWIDTSMLASLVFPEFESYSLSYMSTVLNLNHEPVHRALGDVHATQELLSRCWERLLELPADLRGQAQEIMQRAPEGYRHFFGALPEATQKEHPVWLRMPPAPEAEQNDPIGNMTLEKPDSVVALLEEPPAPGVLEELIRTAVAKKGSVHWIAVKNLEATVKRLSLPEGVRVLLPPFQLLDTEMGNALLEQKSLTADEATLALKLLWYTPRSQRDFPLHGDEVSVWNGKLACTEESATYNEQFVDLPGVVLLDHRQILSFVADPKHTGRDALSEKSHVIIDDASMLEDTATKAYGWQCILPYLRAAAEGNEKLTKLADIAELWAERTRNAQDLRYITIGDLETPDVRGMCTILEEALQDAKLPQLALRQLSHLQQILQPENLKERIAYIELRFNGDLSIHSAPDRIGTFLQQHLYNIHPTTLLIPPMSANTLTEILPTGTEMKMDPALSFNLPFRISYPEEMKLETLMANPPPGKTIVLMSSKRSITNVFIKYMETLEKKGTTLICQGLSGGTGRMQAEFIAAKGTVLWFITPWSFEGITLPSQSVDRLLLLNLPFDHPSHAILSRRAEHYQNAFTQYALARLLHRLFRLLRTFSSFCKESADVLMADDRLTSKSYGKDIQTYLAQFKKE
ncbi:hypothetical protein COU76_01055 [Candidatus Peregrinibacteria bacterium CG10_big_fil_rev_8_21_14_0_10_49_10]|nr:MAG: hypothetical protein COU76_01055 [Candidatus Peregrinibacteria bacterium CG10_big_fil_rev_8_21_14_0_10_49_10]